MKKTVRPSATPSRRGPRNHRILGGQVKVTFKVRKLYLGFHLICNRPGWDFRDLASYIKARREPPGDTGHPTRYCTLQPPRRDLAFGEYRDPVIIDSSINRDQTSRSKGITSRRAPNLGKPCSPCLPRTVVVANMQAPSNPKPLTEGIAEVTPRHHQIDDSNFEMLASVHKWNAEACIPY